jgi:hypothetical protein
VRKSAKFGASRKAKTIIDRHHFPEPRQHNPLTLVTQRFAPCAEFEQIERKVTMGPKSVSRADVPVAATALLSEAFAV